MTGRSTSAIRTAVFTGGIETSGVEPILAALKSQGIEYLVIDTAVDRVTTTLSGTGEAILTLDDNLRFSIDPESRILLWRATPPSAGIAVENEPDVVRFARKSELVAWRSLLSLPAHWTNRDSCRRRFEHNKLLQCKEAARLGLVTIPTILTSSTDDFLLAVERFGGDVAVKAPVSWHRVGLDGDIHVATYTRRLTGHDARELAKLVPAAPVFVQPYISKAYELRVTVVAAEAFACRIDSQASSISMTDWRRYDLANVAHEPFDLDEHLRTTLCQLVAECGLDYAAIDLIVQPDGTTVFVEMNPSGHYAWIESLTGMPISIALARHLSG